MHNNSFFFINISYIQFTIFFNFEERRLHIDPAYMYKTNSIPMFRKEDYIYTLLIRTRLTVYLCLGKKITCRPCLYEQD